MELESLGQNSVPGRGYGIGPKLMRVDDVVVPLWGLKDDTSKSGFHIGTSETGVQLSTMLAVRCVEERLSGIPGEDRSVQAGRIIGPVT